jgi:large subunit ribosomal protein L20
MVRVKRGNVARKSRKKILYLAKGFRGTHSKLFRIANGQVMKALRYSYIGRKQRKQQFRRLWITRINAIVRKLWSLNYSLFMSKLRASKIQLNRKMLSQLALVDPETFQNLKNEFVA